MPADQGDDLMVSKKRRALGFFALAAALCMLAATIAAPFFCEDEPAAEQEDLVLAGWTDNLFNEWKDENGNIRWGFFAADIVSHLNPLSLAGWELAEYYYKDGIIPPGDPPAGDQDEIEKQIRSHEAELVYTILNSNKELLTNSISGYADIWKFSNTYWMRQSEIAATEYWTLGSVYDSTDIYLRSGLGENLAKLFANIESGPDATFSLLNDRLTVWSKEAGYGSMKVVVMYGSTELMGTSMDIKIRNAINVTSTDGDKAYLDNRELWVTGGSAKIWAEDGTQYTLQNGYNDLSALGLKPGVYEFQTGRVYAGSVSPSLASDAANVYASAVLVKDNEYNIAVYNNSRITVGSSNYDSLIIKIATGDGTYSSVVDLMPILSELNSMIGSAEDTLTKSHVASQAVWKVFDTTKEANILLSPSSLVPDNSVAVSADEMYMLTISYLQQVYDMYKRTNGNISQTGFMISADSLDLLVRGDVLDANGTVLYENVAFTPYVWLNSLALTIGSVSVDQSGTAAVWGECSDLRSWTGSDEAPRLVQLTPGYSFNVKQIMKAQTVVDSYTVGIKEVQKWHDIVITPGPDPLKMPKVLDAGTLMAIIFIEAAAIMACLWVITDQWIFLIPAAILLVIGLIGGDWVARTIAGML